jgi:transposase
MLADQLDYVVGVDPHRDFHALAVVHVVSGVVVCEATVFASRDGYAHALKLVDQHAAGRRAFAVEGTGSFGAGLTRFLTVRGEQVLEVGRLRRERRSGGKTDALDAVRAARSVLTNERPATPRAGGERQALQALVAAREGAVNAKRAGLCQLRDLLITTPEPLRGQLRLLTRARLLQRLAAARPGGGRDPELRGSMLALRSVARRVLQLTAEERGLALEIEALTEGWRRSCSTSLAADPTLLHSSFCPGHTKDGSAPKQPSHDSPAQPRSLPLRARRSATGSTEAATENSTAHCT